jgi:hypothetical protein
MRETRNRHRVLAGSSEVSRPPGTRSHIYTTGIAPEETGEGWRRVVMVVLVVVVVEVVVVVVVVVV